MAAPLTGMRTASMRSACTMPGSLPTAASSVPGSENGATTSRSGWTVRRSGATVACRVACGAAAGTGEPGSSRARPDRQRHPGDDGGAPGRRPDGGQPELSGAWRDGRAVRRAAQHRDEGAGHGAKGREHGEAGRQYPPSAVIADCPRSPPARSGQAHMPTRSQETAISPVTPSPRSLNFPAFAAPCPLGTRLRGNQARLSASRSSAGVVTGARQVNPWHT